ncbi:hypothetical protein EJ08DRAFT_331638 [Tothia fuscella]|uniref:Uncharacterized protein n=1 Tax=Tothia fuscella TaxID=1048955 RepID=A0A9P4TW88_9PEZI|nr:hypothetical protein EJ08DRAFT_331638 [Tothia fuscella]
MPLQILFVRRIKRVCSTSSCGQCPTSPSTACGIVSSAGGFGIFLSTLLGVNGTNPHAARPVLIFLAASAVSLAGMYRDVKCCLPIVFTPPCSSRSACSR